MNTWQSHRIDVKTLKNNNDFTVLFLIHSCGVWYRLNLILNIKPLICCECKMECFTWNPVFFFLIHSLKICMLVSFVCGLFFFSLHTFWSRSSKNHFCNIFVKLTCDPIICLRYLYRKHFYSHFNSLWMQSIGLVLAPFWGTLIICEIFHDIFFFP